MSSLITRRGLITTGLFAAPAIIAIDRLMPIRAQKEYHIWHPIFKYSSESVAETYYTKIRPLNLRLSADHKFGERWFPES